ncbi:MAG: hypothetical protein H6544_04410 [Prevotellaceae bacterium]|nr:hypothetical protein [Prevotellaceae bacterium]
MASKILDYRIGSVWAANPCEYGENLTDIQVMLGHESSKTTEIHTHVIAVNNKKTFDILLNITNLETVIKTIINITDIYVIEERSYVYRDVGGNIKKRYC